MSALEPPKLDIEAGAGRRRQRRSRRRPSAAGSSVTATDASLCFSDSDSDDQSWHSPLNSIAGGSYDECRFAEIESVLEPPRSQSLRESSVTDCLSDEEVDLESGELETKVHSARAERDCRICHLKLMGSGGGSGDQESGVAIELGCSCKGDLGAAHEQCAETWFKIKGDTICEICGATALNVTGEQGVEANNVPETAAAPPAILSESQSSWDGRRIMNFLLACMIFAFVISWLFHFNVMP